MAPFRSSQTRILLFSLLLSLLVIVSFAWQSRQSLVESFAEARRDQHAGLFRVADEHLTDYLFNLERKLAAAARNPAVGRFLGGSLGRTDYPAIQESLVAVEEVLAQQFWPQSKVDELVIVGDRGLAARFGVDASQWYLGESFDLDAVLASRPEWRDLSPGGSLLTFSPWESATNLTPTMGGRLVFLKRLVPGTGPGGYVLAVLSPAFLPGLFEGLEGDTRGAVADPRGRAVWSWGGAPAPETAFPLVRSSFVLGTSALALSVESRAEGPSGPSVDLVLGLLAVSCLVLAAVLAFWLAPRTLSPLVRLADRLGRYGPGTGGDPAGTVAVPGPTLLVRLTGYFALSILVPAIVFLGSAAAYSYRVTEGVVRASVSETINQAQAYFDYQFRIYNELTSQFVYNDQFQSLWFRGSAHPVSRNLQSFVPGFYADLRRSRGEFTALNLYALDGSPLTTGLDLEGSRFEELLGDRRPAVDASIGQLVFVGAVRSSYKQGLLMFCRKVRGLNFSDHREVGYAVFFVDPYPLSQVYGVLGTKLALYLELSDRWGQSLVGYRPPAAGPSAGAVSLGREAPSGDYRVSAVVPAAEIRLLLLPVLWTAALFVLFYLVIILGFSLLFTVLFMRPLRRLLVELDQPVPRGLGLRSELAEIATRFNDLILDNYRTRLLEREAQLNALQQQINPHFMFNTLEAIKWMAYQKDAGDIAEMASAMGSFLRGNMALGDPYTTLAEEIEHLKSYLTIQQIRYGDRFTVEWDVQEGLLGTKVVRLILQPLVENAINHGFHEIRHQGRLTIRVRRVEGVLRIEIEDNGRGLDPETLERVRQAIEAEDPGRSESIGLSNVSRRLRLCLGPGAGVTLTSTGRGTVAALSLPG